MTIRASKSGARLKLSKCGVLVNRSPINMCIYIFFFFLNTYIYILYPIILALKALLPQCSSELFLAAIENWNWRSTPLGSRLMQRLPLDSPKEAARQLGRSRQLCGMLALDLLLSTNSSQQQSLRMSSSENTNRNKQSSTVCLLTRTPNCVKTIGNG